MLPDAHRVGVVLLLVSIAAPANAATELAADLDARPAASKLAMNPQVPGPVPAFDAMLSRLPGTEAKRQTLLNLDPIDSNLHAGGPPAAASEDAVPSPLELVGQVRRILVIEKNATELRRELRSLIETMIVLLAPLVIWLSFVGMRRLLRRLRPVGWSG